MGYPINHNHLEQEIDSRCLKLPNCDLWPLHRATGLTPNVQHQILLTEPWTLLKLSILPLTSFLISLTICSSAHQASLQIAILNLFPLKFLVAHSTRFNQQHSVSEIKQRFIFVRFFGDRAKEKKMVSGLYANIPFIHKHSLCRSITVSDFLKNHTNSFPPQKIKNKIQRKECAG